MVKIRKSYVVVVGCGGVGSWAALMLLRRQVLFTQVSKDMTDPVQRCRPHLTDRLRYDYPLLLESSRSSYSGRCR